jgi:hypothetical protein
MVRSVLRTALIPTRSWVARVNSMLIASISDGQGTAPYRSGNAEACDDIHFDIMSASALRARYLRRGISIALKERRKQSGLAISA